MLLCTDITKTSPLIKHQRRAHLVKLHKHNESSKTLISHCSSPQSLHHSHRQYTQHCTAL